MSTNIFGDPVVEEGSETNVFGDPVVSTKTATALPVTSGTGLPSSVVSRMLARPTLPQDQSQGPVELLNQTIPQPSQEEVSSLLSDPEWVAATEARREPNVVQAFMHPENPLNVLNFPKFFMRGAGKATAGALNTPTHLARALGLTPSTVEVFGATPQTQPIQLPFASEVPSVELIPELEREKYSPVTRAMTDTLSGFTTPENLALLPLVANKFIQALFLSQMVPGTYESAKETVAPGKTEEERIESGVHTGLGALMTAGLGKALAKQKPGMGEGIRPDAFEEAWENLTPGEKTDIRGRGVRAGYEGEVPLVGGERLDISRPTYYDFPRPMIKPGYQAAGEAKTGGQVSFLAEAGAEGVPSARQTAVAERPLREVSEQERLMQGGFVPATETGRAGGMQLQRAVEAARKKRRETGALFPKGNERRADVERYEYLTKKVLQVPEQAKALLFAEIEQIKNKYGGFPPTTTGERRLPISEGGEESARVIREDQGSVQGYEAQKGTEEGTAQIQRQGGKEVSGYDVQQPAGREGETGGEGQPRLDKGIGASGRRKLEEQGPLGGESGSISSDFLTPEFWEKELGFAKGVKVSAGQLYNRVRNKLGEKSLAWETVKDVLPKEGVALTTDEAREVVRTKGPRVEVRKFGNLAMPDSVTKRQDRLNQLLHEIETAGVRILDVEGNRTEGKVTPEVQKKLDEYKQLHEESRKEVRQQEPERSHWQSVSPKPESEMEGYVELAVVKSPRGSSFDREGQMQTMEEGAQFPSSHSFPPNTLGFVRGYMETTKDGKKVFHVVEVQSDWAQRVREENEAARQQGGTLAKSRGFTATDPLLPHWERLALKAAIEHARKQGADAIAVQDAESAMMMEGHDALKPAMHKSFDTREAAEKWAKSMDFLSYQIRALKNANGSWFVVDGQIDPDQAPGMRLHYDQILPRIAEELTGKKGERVEFGEHKMAFGRDTHGDQVQRQNLIFRDPSGKPKTSVSARTFPLKGVKKELSMVGKDKAETPVEKAVSKAEEELGGGQKGIGKTTRNVPSGSEEGAFSLLPVKQAAETAGKVGKKVGQTVATPIRAYVEPMVERLGRVGGPVAKKVSEEAHGIVKQGKYWYGQISPQIDKAKAEFGGGSPFQPSQFAKTAGVTTEGLEPTTWVRELNEVNEGAAFNNFYGANEKAVTVPNEVRPLIKTGDTANMAVGNLAVKANPDFKPTGKLQRILNNFGMDIILRGGGEAWDNWVKGIAEVNKNDPSFKAAVAKSKKTPEAYIGDFFHKWKKELDAPGSDATTLDRIAQDFHRTMPRTITHVKALGQWHEVIVADPFNYFESAAQRTAHAVAFREVYPLVRDPNTGKLQPSGYLQKTREAVMREVPTDVGQKEFDNLMRTLQGHPLDRFTGGATAPDTIPGMGYRMAREVALRPLKALMLSANAPVNLSEVVAGGPAIFLGLRNVTKGMVRLAKDKTLYTQLEQQGLVNRAMYNFANDPNSPVRSATRRLSNATSKATFQQALNELQEAEAAVTAKVAADRVRGKINLPLSERELGLLEQTIRAMGLSPERAAKAVRGKDEQALQIFESKAAAWLTAGNQAVGEMSRAGVSRVFNELFWFHRYSQMVGNQFRTVGGNLAGDLSKWSKAKTRANWRPVRYNAELAGRMLAGRGFQGAVTLGIMATVTGGVAGLIAKKNEAEDAPLQFMTDSFMQGVGGPLSILRRLAQNTHDSASLEQNLVELSPPLGVAGDFFDAMTGVGRYEGRRPDERVAMFLESKSPGWKGVKTGMALFHIGDPSDQELEAATRAFYRWRNQQPGFPKGTEEQIDLRTQVKRVREKLLEGDDWQAELKKVTDLKYAADALRAGTLLEIAGKPLSAEQVKQLESRIGKRAVEKLRLRDAAVRELGRELGEAEKKDQPVMSIEKPTGKLARDFTTETQRREAVEALLSPATRKLLESSKMETPTYDPDIRPGRPVRELTREEAAVFNEEFAKQLDIRLAPLTTDPSFQSLPLPLRRKRLEDRAETARRRAQNITRGRLQQGRE